MNHTFKFNVLLSTTDNCKQFPDDIKLGSMEFCFGEGLENHWKEFFDD